MEGETTASNSPERESEGTGASQGGQTGRPRALLLENVDPVAVELLSSAGYEVESLRGALDEPT
jgi:hypothetical protein